MSEIEPLWFGAAALADDACGPDLDLAGDDDHLGFLARVEGVLPSAFAEFERSQINFEAEFKAADALLKRSRDLRVLVLVAKLMILDRRLPEFAGVVAGMADLLNRQWDAVHPADDIELRRGVLMALDDMPHSVMPLQATPLFESRNLGRVSFRHHLIAAGSVQPRENEDAHQASAIAAALERADIAELTASRAALQTLRDGLGAIAASFATHLGAGRDLALPNLRKLVGDQITWLDGEIGRRSPAQAATATGTMSRGEDGEKSPASATAITTQAAAKGALDAVAAYLARYEPSSPGLLLVRQCRQLADVSFIEALRTLMPDAFPAASIRIGRGAGFNIAMEQLTAFETPGAAEEENGDEENDVEEHPGPQDDKPTSFDDDEAAEKASENTEFEPEISNVHGRTAAIPQRFKVLSQRDAVDLMAQVAGYYRSEEPSSPLPLLLDRARALAGRDFLAVLEELLPASHLHQSEER
ncbi:MAG: hypothetical protein FD175_1510 [Beijerinckiaceae bacterium]|nr:MAG: hypothetical protein FD175_1510 [Beijerinckiaceae bacterium]